MNSKRSAYGFAHSRRGQTMMEYVLIVSAVAVSAFAAFQTFGAAVISLMHSLMAAL